MPCRICTSLQTKATHSTSTPTSPIDNDEYVFRLILACRTLGAVAARSLERTSCSTSTFGISAALNGEKSYKHFTEHLNFIITISEYGYHLVPACRVLVQSLLEFSRELRVLHQPWASVAWTGRSRMTILHTTAIIDWVACRSRTQCVSAKVQTPRPSLSGWEVPSLA